MGTQTSLQPGPRGRGDPRLHPHPFPGFTLSQFQGCTTVPTRPALPGGSSPASTLPLTAHKTGLMAPGMVATTLRISSSETQKPSLWRTFPQRKQGTALRADRPAEPGGRAGSPLCRGPGTHRDPWPSRSRPPHQGSQDTWCPVPSGQVSPSLGHHLPDKCPRDSAEDASSCLSLLCSGRKSS